MVWPNDVYRVANRKLPVINREACKVFDVEETGLEIIRGSKEFKLFGAAVFPITYGIGNRALVFHAENVITDYKESEWNIDDYVTYNLAHEASHYEHDRVTGFEYGRDIVKMSVPIPGSSNISSGLIQKLLNSPKIIPKALVSWGISEGVADYSQSIILENLSKDRLLERFRINKDEIQNLLNSAMRSVDNKKISEIISPTEFCFDEYSLVALGLVSHRFRKEIQSEGLEYLRNFARDFRPSDLTDETVEKILTNVLSEARY